MTQEDKQLLLQDLCARLPYKCKYKASKKITHWHKLTLSTGTIDNIIDDYYDEIKPYLRPMSSMTEDEKREIYNWLVENDVDWFDFSKLRFDEILISFDSSWLLVNWLLKNHFDFMDLIQKGLALEAPKGMYNLKEK